MAHILIVGAGPTGLTCAVELARQHHDITIIEQKSEREHISKAIGINTRSLELLEAADVTPRLIAAGLQLQTSHMHYNHHDLVIDLRRISHRYNFMLALPQDETEAILEKRLNELGIQVERKTTLTNLLQSNNSVTVQYETNGKTTEALYDFVIGADGAHSKVRKLINQPFLGKAYEQRWNLADVRMEWKYDNSAAHAFINMPGSIGVVIPIGNDRYRLVANHPNAIRLLPSPYTIHQTIWQSDFSISCRLVENYQQGRVFLAGDSAHIHTPVGGRGMNLGIEDACVLADLLTQNKWQEYNTLRHPVGKKVVESTDKMYRLLAETNPLMIQIRNNLLFPMMRLPWIQKKQVREVVGLNG